MGAGRVAMLAVLGGLCALPAQARAGDAPVDMPARQSGPLEIEWVAPEGCPDRAQVVSAIERHLEHPSRAREGFAAHIEAEQRGPRRWRMSLHIRVPGAAGERVVEGGSCAEVAEAAALMVALALDAIRAAHVLGEVALPDLWDMSPLPASVAPEPPVPLVPAGVRPRSAAGDRVTSRPHVEWRVRSTVAYGALALPGGGFGVGAGAALLRERLRIDLSGAYWFERTESVAGEADEIMAGGSFRMEAAALRGCWRIAKHVGAGCLGAELGAMRATGFGVERQRAARELWVAPLASLLGDYKLTRLLSISAIADYALALRRPRFVLSGVGPVHQPGRAALRLYLGVEARFR